MKRQTKFIITLLLSLLLFTACSEESTSPEVKSLSDELAEKHSGSTLPGFTYAIVKDGNVTLSGFHGYANVETGLKYDGDTRQSVASVSKAVLGVAIAKAIDLNYFTLETNINEILPFEVVNPYYSESEIRVKHLVTHTSGIVDDINFFFATYRILPNQNMESEPALMMLNALNVSREELPSAGVILYEYLASNGDYYSAANYSNYAPGMGYSYSNIGASLAALLIEIKSGMPYSEFVKDNIFLPLDMTSTSFEYGENFNTGNYAKLYFDHDSAYPFYQCALYASGSLITTTNDLTKFLTEMIKGYAGTSQQALLSDTGYELLFNKLYTDTGSGVKHGVFWFLEGDEISHAGTDLGTVAKIHFNPKTNNGFVFMSNSEVQFSAEGENNLNVINDVLYRLIDEMD
ncbi:MAG: hypothetical protein SCALA702_27930 [Melioribacteraceae bacterium]|nr:MAG: hypothetical protein SCALA702_27930 [Melioribacteraceae bacterium]